MHVVVCTKQTPDSAAVIKIEEGKAAWGESPMVVNPWDEYAIEEAIRIKENKGGKATAITLGPDRAREVLKTCIAMGCDEAVLVSDEAFDGSDARVTATILAAAIRKLGDVDLVIFGKQAIDGDTGLVPMAVARILGWSPLSYVFEISELEPDEKQIRVARLLEEGRQLCSAALPAVVSVVKDINEPRYPSFIGIRRAGKAEIPVWTAEDLELDSSSIGAAASAVSWSDIRSLPQRSGSVEIIEGDTPAKIAATLADRLLAEKVI